MKRLSRILLFFIFLFLTAACHRLASSSSVDLSQFTPGAPTEALEKTETDETDLSDSSVEQTLRIYPLYVGSSWVYEYLGYDENREVVWRVVETVVASDIVDGYYAVKMERTAALVDGFAPEGFISTPETGTFWYFIDGMNLYTFEGDGIPNPLHAWLDLIVPFPGEGIAWYPDPDLRAENLNEINGSRFASDPFRKVLPMGGIYTCYNITTQYDEYIEEGTFCETVGFVYQESTHLEPAYGYRMELEGYSLQ